MTDIIARLRIGRLIFETVVDLESAMKLRRGEKVDINQVIRDNAIYTDQKKGMKAGHGELEQAFGTTIFDKIVENIVKKGMIEVTQDFRDEALENRKKQIIDFLIKNAMDSQSGRPFTSQIIESALKEAGIKIENKNVESQIIGIIDKLRNIIPIKVQTKRLKIDIPSNYTGKVYGLIQEYKEKEEWLSNGDLQVVLNIPVGIQMEFYDKLNGITHGSAISQEIK